jgi:hypothetical protein
MPVHKVENYVLRYDLGGDHPWVIVHYEEDGTWHNVDLYPPASDAVYLADMLRNEKPVYYVESSTGRRWLTTSAEAIGEEETP